MAKQTFYRIVYTFVFLQFLSGCRLLAVDSANQKTGQRLYIYKTAISDADAAKKIFAQCNMTNEQLMSYGGVLKSDWDSEAPELKIKIQKKSAKKLRLICASTCICPAWWELANASAPSISMEPNPQEKIKCLSAIRIKDFCQDLKARASADLNAM